MDEIMRDKCRAYFKAANQAECVYVAGDKLFIDEGAARSYCAEVETVKRAEVMAAEVEDPKDGEKKLNPKTEE
jgi:dTDP-glucose pyrophosphorylase